MDKRPRARVALVAGVAGVAVIASVAAALHFVPGLVSGAAAPITATASVPVPASAASPTPATPSATPSVSALPASAWASSLSSGPWPTSHVQGIAVDRVRGFIYYSFTTVLVKTDRTGKVLGTVRGFTGHLGDLDFNEADGRVYGSLEYKAEKAFYIAIFDVDKIDRIGVNAQNSSIVTTVYLPQVVADFTADLDHNGRFAGDTASTSDHRYGCSGIDGVAFGPRFGSVDGPNYLTVAYGIYQNNNRTDNDNQVFLQFDTKDWTRYEQPLVQGKPHRVGPTAADGKYFLYTSNTRFGVQNLEYDPWNQRWLAAVYPGSKPGKPRFTLFSVAADAKPAMSVLRGLGGEKGLLLALAPLGRTDRATGLRGWYSDCSYGIQAVGPDLFYVAASTSVSGGHGARLTLQTWTGAASDPFTAA